MSFVEFIKNPSVYIWGYLDKKKSNNTNSISSSPSSTPSVNNESYNSEPSVQPVGTNILDTLISDFKGFLSAVESKDWRWLLRGKTGLFLKLALPVILVFYILSLIITPKPISIPKNNNPSVIDPGDTLTKPKFKSSNYINGAFSNGRFMLYSPDAAKINEFGLRGILLNTFDTDRANNYYYALNKESFLFIKNGQLLLRYFKLVEITNVYPRRTEKVEDFIPIIDSISDYKEIKNLQITYDNNFCFILDNKLLVYNLAGEKVKEYDLKPNTISPTFYGGEVYYVKEVPSDEAVVSDSTSTNSVKTAESKSTFYLIRLNKNDEEVYSQNLGTLRVQKISVVNEDRYLVLIERPSENSFFNIQMRDSGKRTIFNVQPNEKDVKVTLVNNLYFNSEDNTIFMQGNGVAKLFNLNGEQLWIN